MNELKVEEKIIIFGGLVMFLLLALVVLVGLLIRADGNFAINDSTIPFAINNDFGGEEVEPVDPGDKIQPSSNREVVELNEANYAFEMLDDPKRAHYKSDEAEKYFEIELDSNAYNNTLVTSDGLNNIVHVANGKWSSDYEYILFTKQTNELGVPDLSELWILKWGSSAPEKIIDTEPLQNIAYVSNGINIGFVTPTKVGIYNIALGETTIVYEFEQIESRSEFIYIPDIKILTTAEFEVSIALPTFYEDGAKEVKRFAF